MLIEQLHRFLAVARLIDAVPGTDERRCKQLPDCGFVFDEQDRFAPLRPAGLIGLRPRSGDSTAAEELPPALTRPSALRVVLLLPWLLIPLVHV